MGKRVNIGIYIGPDDIDIAAWFNLLKRSGQSYTRWVKAVLASYALNEPVKIGIIDRRAPLIRGKDGQPGGNTVKSTGPYRHGWQIKGPNGETVIGSVVNISVSRQDMGPVLEEAWANGHKLATFVKSLIRKNLKAADRDVPPKNEEFARIWAAYLVHINSKKTGLKKELAQLDRPAAADPGQDSSWVEDAPAPAPDPKPKPQRHKPAPPPPAEPEPAPLPDSDRAFSFTDEEAEDAVPNNPDSKPQGNSGLGLNPFINLI